MDKTEVGIGIALLNGKPSLKIVRVDVILAYFVLQVVIFQMNGRNYSSHSVHLFHVSKTRIKLSKGWMTKARESYSGSMQVSMNNILLSIPQTHHSKSNNKMRKENEERIRKHISVLIHLQCEGYIHSFLKIFTITMKKYYNGRPDTLYLSLSPTHRSRNYGDLIQKYKCRIYFNLQSMG